MLFYIYIYKQNKSYKKNFLQRLIISDTKEIKDPIYNQTLYNNGHYNGCLRNIDNTIHNLFKVSDRENDSIERLRFRLLKEWKPSLTSTRYLLSIHLIRVDGNLRTTSEEIAYSILKNYKFSVIGHSLNFIKKPFTTRRKSSQRYLVQNKKKSKPYSKKSKSYSKKKLKLNSKKIKLSP